MIPHLRRFFGLGRGTFGLVVDCARAIGGAGSSTGLATTRGSGVTGAGVGAGRGGFGKIRTGTAGASGSLGRHSSTATAVASSAARPGHQA